MLSGVQGVLSGVQGCVVRCTGGMFGVHGCGPMYRGCCPVYRGCCPEYRCVFGVQEVLSGVQGCVVRSRGGVWGAGAGLLCLYSRGVWARKWRTLTVGTVWLNTSLDWFNVRSSPESSRWGELDLTVHCHHRNDSALREPLIRAFFCFCFCI